MSEEKKALPMPSAARDKTDEEDRCSAPSQPQLKPSSGSSSSGSSSDTSQDDSPNFTPEALRELEARGFVRVNDPRSTDSSGPEPKNKSEWIEECAQVCDAEARRLRGAGVYEARAQTAWECARLIRLLLGRKA